MKKGTMNKIALLLILVGAINWGLFGVFGVNLVAIIFGSIPVLETVVYALVGISGIYYFPKLLK